MYFHALNIVIVLKSELILHKDLCFNYLWNIDSNGNINIVATVYNIWLKKFNKLYNKIMLKDINYNNYSMQQSKNFNLPFKR